MGLFYSRRECVIWASLEIVFSGTDSLKLNLNKNRQKPTGIFAFDYWGWADSYNFFLFSWIPSLPSPNPIGSFTLLWRKFYKSRSCYFSILCRWAKMPTSLTLKNGTCLMFVVTLNRIAYKTTQIAKSLSVINVQCSLFIKP